MSITVSNTVLSQTNVIDGNNNKSTKEHSPRISEQNQYYKWDIVWRNVFGLMYFHLAALYGAYLIFSLQTSWKTLIWTFYIMIISGLGATAGSHRLWTHNTYKAKLPLRMLLIYWQCTCFQNSVYEWTRDHRVHHKYADTDADPHNAARGFFFSHVGWLLVRKHKDVKEKGKTVWMEDLERDPIVMFQKKHYPILMILCCFVIPTVVPWYFWGETLSVAWHVSSMFRFMFTIHVTWAVNSAAHLYGYKPYDKSIYAGDNTIVSYIALGEGWHNYHHVFPWDYKTSELKSFGENVTTYFIDLMAKIGLAYDLKTVPEELIRKRMLRTGEGSVKHNGKVTVDENIAHESNDKVWGWDDVNMSLEDRKLTTRYYKTED